jgi:Secretion system C-terminal sorting domain
MKKFEFVVFCCLCFVAGNAREFARHAGVTGNTNSKNAYRTTGGGDTTWFSNILATDTLTVYPVGSGDSGYYSGTNIYNDISFAERYKLNVSDSTIAVIGVYALFTGVVNPASVANVSFKVWSQGPQVQIAQNVVYSGFPDAILDSVVVPFTTLGIGQGGAVDTQKSFYFAPPWINTGNVFFVGYSLNYDFNTLNGDTIALKCTKDGERHTPPVYVQTTVSGADTVTDSVFLVQNATLWADQNWHDNFSQGDSIFDHLAIFPIVIIGDPNGVRGVTASSLSFMGNMPNPATDRTAIHISLACPDNVTVTVVDAMGRTVLTKNWNALTPGVHDLELDTHQLVSGTYMYTIRTASGDGFASKLEIVR